MDIAKERELFEATYFKHRTHSKAARELEVNNVGVYTYFHIKLAFDLWLERGLLAERESVSVLNTPTEPNDK